MSKFVWCFSCGVHLHPGAPPPLVTPMETILVADYTGHHLIMLPVQEINLKSCATLTVTQIIQYVWEINRDHSCYLFSSREQC